MSEQQRIFTAVLLCMAILLGWQFFMVPPVPQQAAPHPASPAAGSTAQSPGAQATPQAQASAAAAPQANHQRTTRPFETPLLRGAISDVDGALVQVELLGYRERTKGAGADSAHLSLAPTGFAAGQARLLWDLGPGAPVLHFTDASGLHLQGETAAGMQVTVEILPRQDAYALDYVVRTTNRSAAPTPSGLAMALALVEDRADEGGLAFFGGGGSQPLGALCEAAGSVERKEIAAVTKKPWQATGSSRFVGLDRQHFVVAVVPQDGGTGDCRAHANAGVLEVIYGLAGETVAAGSTVEKRFSVYLGPKRESDLAAVSPLLVDVVDYNIMYVPLGFLARPMVYLLKLFYGWTGSWGIAIALLTGVVKLLLFPVTYKSVLSMRKMQLLKPEMDRIKSQFEHDKERQQMEQMKLFREKGVNPLGGCLPMLAQMPVWLALYRTLLNAVDLYQQPFLWLPDLTAKEPFPLLALLVGALTILQQKMTPQTGMDNQQAKMMMYVMPVMFTFFMIALPSGLVLYILINSILTIIQQLAINRRAVTV